MKEKCYSTAILITVQRYFLLNSNSFVMQTSPKESIKFPIRSWFTDSEDESTVRIFSAFQSQENDRKQLKPFSLKGWSRARGGCQTWSLSTLPGRAAVATKHQQPLLSSSLSSWPPSSSPSPPESSALWNSRAFYISLLGTFIQPLN